MLLGRESECAAVDRVLHAARASRSGMLVVRGEAGIGKSALLGHAVAHADGMRVLTGAGVEAESELPFAGLHQLLWPILDLADGLPGVEYHLRKVFAKLGISSRMELVDLELDQAEQATELTATPAQH